MNVHARARASAQAIDRSATRVDPVAGLDDLLRRRRRQPLQWAAAAWVLNSGNSTISRLDPDTGRIEATFAVQLPEKRVGASRFATVADGRLWVVSAVDDDAPKSAISAIDPSTGHTLTRFELGGSVFQDQVSRGDVAIGSGTVWVALQSEDEIRRIDAATGTLLDQIPLPDPTALAVDGETLWAATADGRLYSIVAGTGGARVRATTGMVTRIRVGQGGVWLMTSDGKVLRLDPRTGRPLVELDSRVLAVGDGAVWVVDKGAGTLLRVAT